MAVPTSGEDPAEPGPEPGPEPETHRNAWRWVSALLAVAAVALLIWALGLKSEADEAGDELDSTQQELVAAQEQLELAEREPAPTPEPTPEPEDDPRGGRAILTAGAVAAVTAVIDDLEKELGATHEDLEAAEQDLEDVTAQAEEAGQDAAAAKKQADKAGDALDSAEAEADQAEAELDAAESRAAVARACARAYVTAIGQLFEGEDVEDQAAEVREQMHGVTAQCQSAFAEA